MNIPSLSDFLISSLCFLVTALFWPKLRINFQKIAFNEIYECPARCKKKLKYTASKAMC